MIYFISKNQTINSVKDKLMTIGHWQFLSAWTDRHSEFSFDLETTGLDPHTDKILLAQFGNEKTQFVVDVQSFGVDFIKYFEKVLTSSGIKIGANLTFDYKMLLGNYGIRMENIWDCSRVDEVLYNGLFDDLHENPEQQKRLYYKSFSLASMAKRYLDLDVSKEERKSFISHPLGKEFSIEQILYAAKDVEIPSLVKEKQSILVEKYKLKQCIDLENRVALVIGDLEFEGVGFNRFEWLKLAGETEKKLAEATLELDAILLRQMGGTKYKILYKQGVLNLFDEPEETPTRLTTVDWESPDQTLSVLNSCGFKLEDTTKRSLNKYAKTSQLVRAIFIYRELAKSVSTYGKGFIKNIHPKTGRIHTHFEQLYPATGRLSSSNPNLQNIKRGSAYRDCYVPRPGYDMITADYSNQELRLIADKSEDPLWLQAFKDGVDLHGLLASKTFGIPIEDIKKQFPGAPNGVIYRDVQKMIDFMLAYGGSEHKLADSIDIPIDRAKNIIDMFFSIVPYVKRYLEASGNFGRTYGYCRTFHPIGRIRWFKQHTMLKELSPRDANIILGQIERQSKNTPVQGTGADIVKAAMVNIREYIRKNDLWEILIPNLQVHDELAIECRKDYTAKLKPEIERIMVETGGLFVRHLEMSVSINHADKWLK